MASSKKAEDKDESTDSFFLLRLPSEILRSICSFLPNKDIKSLRLTSTAVCGAVQLRLSRIFLSANPLNISVLRAVAAHPDFRHGVREIIYDDARLADPELRSERINDASQRGFDEELSYEDPWLGEGLRMAVLADVARAWFNGRRRQNQLEMRGRNANDTENLAAQAERAKQLEVRPPLAGSLKAYMELLRQQTEVMDFDDDMDALKEALDLFPKLERLVVTPATHGYLYTPLYRTPMIRSFTYGYNGPLPRGWPTSKTGSTLQEIRPWVPGPSWTPEEVAGEKHRWRGLVEILKTLATRIQREQSVLPELVMDVHSLNTGVSAYMLTQDCEEYENLALLLRQPGFRRLDLPILLGGIPKDDEQILANGRLKSLLAEAPDLQHFRLRLDGQVGPDAAAGAKPPFFPLQTLLPLSTWHRLRHFGLSKFVVRIPDLVAGLALLPRTLRTVELSFLTFDEKDADHAGLLEEMHAGLDWATWRPTSTRPTITLGMAKVENNVDGRGLWFSKEISEYLYEGKPNPFRWHRDILLPGTGWLVDEFDEDFARPYVGYKDYRALWYSEET